MASLGAIRSDQSGGLPVLQQRNEMVSAPRTFVAGLRSNDWTALGPGNIEALVAQCDPAARYASFAGKLDLAQLWNLIENAALLVAPDTGVAHLGKVTGAPTVALFGPGPTRLYGAGEFWKNMPFLPAVLDDLPARNQPTLFRRALPWLQGDGSRSAPCAEPRAVYGRGFTCVAAAMAGILGPLACVT